MKFKKIQGNGNFTGDIRSPEGDFFSVIPDMSQINDFAKMLCKAGELEGLTTNSSETALVFKRGGVYNYAVKDGNLMSELELCTTWEDAVDVFFKSGYKWSDWSGIKNPKEYFLRG